jgi:hypothetical protein
VLAAESVKGGDRGGGVDDCKAVHTMQLAKDEAVEAGATNVRETGARAECSTNERLTTQVEVLLRAAGEGYCFVMLLHTGGWFQPRR